MNDIKEEPIDLEEEELGSPSFSDPLGLNLQEPAKLPEDNLEIEIKDEPLRDIKIEEKDLVVTPEVFICNICHKLFPSKISLDKHELKNHSWSKLPFCCQHCKFGTKSKIAIEKHILFKHILAKCKKGKCKICSKLVFNSYIAKKKKGAAKSKDKHVVHNSNIVNSVVKIGNVKKRVSDIQGNVRESKDKSGDIQKNVSDQKNTNKIPNEIIPNLHLTCENICDEKQRESKETCIKMCDNSSNDDSCNDNWEDSHDIIDNNSDIEQTNTNKTPENLISLEVNNLTCKYCNKKFEKYDILKKHIKNLHQKGSCSKSINDENSKIPCGICHIFVNTKERLKRHMEKRHFNIKATLEEYECKSCKKKFQSNYSLQRHLTSSKVHLIDNKQNENVSDEYKCNICNKQFSSTYQLKRHLASKVHSSNNKSSSKNKSSKINANVIQKYFICHFCNLVVTYKESLTRHIKNYHLSHRVTNYVPRKLSINTDLGIPTVANGILKENIAVCNLCNAKFTCKNNTKYALKRHMRNVHYELEYFDYMNEKDGKIYRENYDGYKGRLRKESLKGVIRHFNSPQNVKTQHSTEIIERKVENKVKKVPEKATCTICNQVLHSKKSLKRHIKSKHEEKSNKNPIKYKCELCEAIFPELYNLQTHEKNVHWLPHNQSTYFFQYMLRTSDLPNNKVTCKLCSFIFTSNELFKKHMQDVHLKPNNIGFKEIITPELEDKIIKNIKKKLHICDICGLQFYKKSILKNHVKLNHLESGWIEGKHYYCILCKKTFVSTKVLMRHTKVMHPKGGKKVVLKCAYCDFQSIHSYVLHKHNLRVHIGNFLNYVCKICKERFSKRKLLNMHMDFKHPNSRTIFTCDICKKTFDMPCNLKTHKLKSHATEKPFLCHLCPRSFAVQYLLTQHIKSHELQMFCCEICGKILKSKTALAQHLEGHAKILKVFCDFCKKGLRSKFGMMKHYLAFHTGIGKPRKPRTMKKMLNN